MKKIGALVIIVIVLVCSLLTGCLAETSQNYFSYTPSLLDSAGFTSQEWIASAESRALFTVFAYLDLADTIQKETDDVFLSRFNLLDSTVIPSQGTLTAVIAGNGNETLVVGYIPVLKMGTYMILPAYKKPVEVSEGTGYPYFVNDAEIIYTTLQELKK